MTRWKGILLAAAPITALLILAGGARFLPSVLGKDRVNDDGAVPQLHREKQIPPKAGKAAPKLAPVKAADAKTQAALKKIVNGQLDAFAKNDFAAALRYSAPEFQNNYSPESFQRMVQGGFADLLQAKSVRFETARCSANRAMMPAFMTVASGQEVGYMYVLRRSPAAAPVTEKGTAVPQKTAEETPDWYIDGVSPVGPRGFPGTGQPGYPRMTDLRDL